jgi:hypothetical protein
MRSTLTLTLTVLLIFSMLVGIRFVNEAGAETLGPIVWPVREYPSSTKVRIFSPQQNNKYGASSILLNFTVEAYEGIRDVGYSLDGGTVERVNNLTKISEVAAPEISNLTPNCVRVTFMGNFFLSNLSRGKHSVTVYQGFQYQDRYEVSTYAYANFTIDDALPSILILSPENTVYTVADVSLNFTVDGSVSQFTYSLDGHDNVPVVGNTTLAGLLAGEHNVTVYVMDSGGNFVESKTITFTIARDIESGKEPFPTVVVATASVAAIAIVSMGLLVYFKKRHPKLEVKG